MMVSQLPISKAPADAARPSEAGARRARAVPHISIHAFCEDRATAETLQAAAADWHLARADMEVCIGGIDAAVAHCAGRPAPDLVVVETTLPREPMLAELDRLAASCSPQTRVLVIGQVNDVALYRRLLQRGVGEYVLAPVSPAHFVEAVAGLFANRGIEPVGSIVAFAGAKGGVGSSTVCHNVAWAMSEALRSHVAVADLDLAFGTASLDFNQEATRGMAEALQAADRLDEALLDRFLTRCSGRLSILAAPLALDRDDTVPADALNAVLDTLRQCIPFVAVDLPHGWTPMAKALLQRADEVVLTATPDLASLRNAKSILDALKPARRAPPHLVINMADMPGRSGLSLKEFDLDPVEAITFEPSLFGSAANNGQMIEEVSPRATAARQFRAMAFRLTHQPQPQQAERPSPFAPILERLGMPLLARRLRPFSTAQAR
jgi:pilus assembly protein CpaE